MIRLGKFDIGLLAGILLIVAGLIAGAGWLMFAGAAVGAASLAGGVAEAFRRMGQRRAKAAAREAEQRASYERKLDELNG